MTIPGTGSTGNAVTDAQRIEIVALAKAGISRNKICVQVFGSKGRNFDKVKVDCYDREIVGWEFAVRGRAKEAARALEMACLTRFGTLRPSGDVPVIRSDTGLIFPSRRLGEACRFYRLPQEFITPYTPEQHGLTQTARITRWARAARASISSSCKTYPLRHRAGVVSS
jgi:transposase InsO family protein